MKKILVTGCGGPAANNFIDALKLCGDYYKIYGVDSNKYMLQLSKADHKSWIVPCDDVGYISELNYLIETHGIDFVHPQPDIEVAAISKHRAELSAPVFLPEDHTVRLCHDKLACTEILRKESVPVPQSYRLDPCEELETTLWLRATRGANSKAALPVNRISQIGAWISYWETNSNLTWYDFMLSEYLPGREYAWQSLWYEGELVVSQARERIEYFNAAYSPTGQTSSPSVARTISSDFVDDIGKAAVLAVDPCPNGVFSVDMKQNAEGVPCVTEINPGRFFTTSNFFAHAGLNIPQMYAELALGEFRDSPGRTDALPENLYWIRQMDMGYRLVDGDLL